MLSFTPQYILKAFYRWLHHEGWILARQNGFGQMYVPDNSGEEIVKQFSFSQDGQEWFDGSEGRPEIQTRRYLITLSAEDDTDVVLDLTEDEADVLRKLVAGVEAEHKVERNYDFLGPSMEMKEIAK